MFFCVVLLDTPPRPALIDARRTGGGIHPKQIFEHMMFSHQRATSVAPHDRVQKGVGGGSRRVRMAFDGKDVALPCSLLKGEGIIMGMLAPWARTDGVHGQLKKVLHRFACLIDHQEITQIAELCP